MPKKPDRPFATIVFSANGKVSSNVEHTDLTIPELELLIARKFTTTLEKRNLRNFSDICISTEEPADVILKKTDDSPLLLQITEVVNQDTRILNETRSRFTSALYNDETIVKQFCGCLVTAIASHEEPRLPIDTDGIIAQIKNLGEKIDTLEIGMQRHIKLQSPPENQTIGLLIQRSSTSKNVIIRTTGSSAITPTNWLLQSIQNKVEKNYSAPQEEFWLLAYGSENPLREEDAHVQETTTYLDSTNHPFDEVWYFYPIPNSEGGSIIRLV